LKDAVSEQLHPQPSHIFELPLGLLSGHLTAADSLPADYWLLPAAPSELS
jgi:hypothetical protein